VSAAKNSTVTETIASAETEPNHRVRGRFAPSPTGDLHVGSLTTAVGSYLDAKSRRGEWLVRIENCDRAREVPGAADRILHTLESFGLQWDGAVWFQHERTEAYAAALDLLRSKGRVYPCSCTRRDLAKGATPEPRYPGHCRAGPRRSDGPHAIRFDTQHDGTLTYTDRLRGVQRCEMPLSVGDFLLRRRDGFYAYQLAVVVDDAAQGISDVVRGADLFDNTPRQRLLQEALGHASPAYMHLPLVVDPTGAKLAKSRRALPANRADAPKLLSHILAALGHEPPQMLHAAPVALQLAWALQNWNIDKIQYDKEILLPDL